MNIIRWTYLNTGKSKLCGTFKDLFYMNNKYKIATILNLITAYMLLYSIMFSKIKKN
jgi:hypothetical protein